METKSSTSATRNLLLIVFMVFHSFWLGAQESGISKRIMSGDQMNSLYIIGSVLIFGIVGYFVYSMIDRNRKEDKPASPRRPVSHHRHHHRIIKKSA